MNVTPILADTKQIKDFIRPIIERNSTEKAWNWFNDRIEKYSKSQNNSDLFLSFSAAVRFMGKEVIALQEEEMKQAAEIRPGFFPNNWTLAQFARTYFLLEIPAKPIADFIDTLDKLFNAADMGELITLYAALPLYPNPESLKKRASEGIRTNISLVFDAIAHHNPYPAEYMEDIAWNQMVLKAIFMERSVYLIHNGDGRVNEDLARMLVDFAHERWAAGRYVTPELWRFVGPFLKDAYLDDIKRLLNSTDLFENKAGVLACYYSNNTTAKSLIEKATEITTKIENGQLSWDSLGAEFMENKN